MSAFRIAIVRQDGEFVHLRPGSQGERDFVDAVCREARGVGLLKTEGQVKKRIAEAVAEVFQAMKLEVEPHA